MLAPHSSSYHEGSPRDAAWEVSPYLHRVNELHFQVNAICNLSCRYCYLGSSGNRLDNDIDLSIIERTLYLVLASIQSDNLTIIYHGGEPLLWDHSMLDEACRLATALSASSKKRVSFGIQSNLTLLDEDHVAVLKRHRVQIGTSIDGPADLHDMHRSHLAETMSGMRLARENGFFSGAICVISNHNCEAMERVLDFYKDSSMTRLYANISRSVGSGSSLKALTPTQIFEAWRDIFCYMVRDGFCITERNVLQKVHKHVFQRHYDDPLALRCDTPFCHAGVTMIAVDAKGDIYPCGCASSVFDRETSMRLGNVMMDPAISDMAALLRFHAKDRKYYDECPKCDARFVCDHGCPAFAAVDPNTEENLCLANQMFAEYLVAQPQATSAYEKYFASIKRTET